MDRELLEVIDAQPSWNCIDPEVYEYLCDKNGMDYHSYDDPDEMFDELKARILGKEK